MKVDPQEVITDAMTSLPMKALGAWLALGLGSFTPVVLATVKSWKFDSDIWLMLIMGPIVACGLAFGIGWWAVIGIPLFLIALCRSLIFLVQDKPLSELYIIFALSFFSSAWLFKERWVLGLIFCPIVLFFLYRTRRNAEPPLL